MLRYRFYKVLRMFHLISKKKYNKIKEKQKKILEYEAIAQSKLFDPHWYLEHNYDVAEAGIDPIRHYLEHGWKENRECSPFFNGQEYLENNPDIAKKNINPLVHYELYGKKENREICTYSTLPADEKLKDNGISLLMDLKNIYGLSQTNRDLLACLKKVHINFDVKDIRIKGKHQVSLKEVEQYEVVPSLQYKKRLIMDLQSHIYDKDYYNMRSIFWEFESGFNEVYASAFREIQEVITFSDFCYKYISSIAPKDVKVTKILYPFSINWKINKSITETRKIYGLDAKDFICFFNFDYNSSYTRKNPEGAINAFVRAFAKKKKAYLIIKTVGYDNYPELSEKLSEYVKKLKISSKVKIINDYMSRDDLATLINSCDVYLSMHRGEGLGLGMLEAMSMGKVVVATNYGGNTEFMNKNNSCPVDYALVEAKGLELPDYKFVKQYAEPNYKQAAEYLRELYQNPGLRSTIGEKAQNFVKTYFNLSTFKQQILEIIKESA